MTKAMTIGELASASGVSARTIRFYEAKGVLPPPRRSTSRYRIYGAADVKRLGLDRRARSIGFSLSEARQMIRLAEHDGCASFQGKVAKSMVRKLGEVDRKIEELNRTRRELQESVKQISRQDGGDCQQAVIECGCTDCRCLGA